MRNPVPYALLFFSGAAGLVYEVCWSRQLGLLVGFGERGAALTIGAFFGGMTVGYAVASRVTARLRQPWRGYAVCELLLAGFAPTFPWLTRHLPDEQPGLWAWLAMWPACALMGASLPFALEGVTRAATGAGRAYAWQLAGATSGSLVATFGLIGWVGVWQSTYLAAAVSASCGLLALTLSSPSTGTDLPAVWPAARWLLAAALGGAATLALQVLAFRLFALSLHNSTYTFGLIVAVFIVCLALGSRWLAFRVAAQPASAQKTASAAAIVAAFGTLAALRLFAALTDFEALRAESFAGYILRAAALVLGVLVLPVTAAGMLLPACWSAAGGRTGRTVAALSALNGLGSVAGALLTTFVLLPRLGFTASLQVVAFSYAVLGVMLARSRWNALAAASSLVPLALLAPSSLPQPPQGHALLARWQTSAGWLDLLQAHEDGSLSARLDLHYQLGSSRDQERHLRMGELPLVLHPRPKHVLFVGLATGMTASAAVSHPELTSIEIVELIPEMRELAQRFAFDNAQLLDDPRVKLVADDGRAYLRRTQVRYDVIVSDLFVPWHSHTGYLYTLEHFQAVAQRLSPGGVFAQWLPLWQLGEEELTSIGDSLSVAFAEPAVWLDETNPGRPLLAFVVGGRTPRVPPTGARRLGRWRRSKGPLNTDDHPLVELLAPHTERSQNVLVGARVSRFLRSKVTPD